LCFKAVIVRAAEGSRQTASLASKQVWAPLIFGANLPAPD